MASELIVHKHGSAEPFEVWGMAGIFPLTVDEWCAANDLTREDLERLIEEGAPLLIVDEETTQPARPAESTQES